LLDPVDPCNDPLMVRASVTMAILSLALLGCDEEVGPASWSYIHEAIIVPNCTASACHSRLSSAFGIELFDREGAYVALTGVVCEQDDPAQPARNFVSPGDPARSKLIALLRGTEVAPMPPDVPLPEAEIALIEKWILEGAECN